MGNEVTAIISITADDILDFHKHFDPNPEHTEAAKVLSPDSISGLLVAGIINRWLLVESPVGTFAYAKSIHLEFYKQILVQDTLLLNATRNGDAIVVSVSTQKHPEIIHMTYEAKVR